MQTVGNNIQTGVAFAHNLFGPLSFKVATQLVKGTTTKQGSHRVFLSPQGHNRVLQACATLSWERAEGLFGGCYDVVGHVRHA